MQSSSKDEWESPGAAQADAGIPAVGSPQAGVPQAGVPQAGVPQADSSRKEEAPSFVVGIGASAGGLDAFGRFFASMPANSDAAFVLVSHLDPTHASMMPDLIRKQTAMDVRQVTEGMRVEPNCVYIIPPNYDITIVSGVLHIEQAGVDHPRVPIDIFLRSLAEDQKEKAICIILSGTGTDGTLGLKAIKAELGMAMVQTVDSAQYHGMPRSASKTGLTDFVLAPEDMPKQLIAYMKQTDRRKAPQRSATQEKLLEGLPEIIEIVGTTTGHDFSLYKKNTICRRVERRMNIHQMESASRYVRYLRHSPQEAEALFKEFLIGVTSFFRNPEAFETLKHGALADLLRKKDRDEPVRIWVPGCSTGEEAYSLAIIIQELMDEFQVHHEVQIFATDIDDMAIDAARTGVYPAGIAADVSPERLKRFFVRDEETYRIRKEVREMLILAAQDIIKDPPFTKLDLISCRNVLIYMDGELQRRVLPLFHYSLRPGGILFLGSSETIDGFVDLFSKVDRKWRIYRRRPSTAARAEIEFPVSFMRRRLVELKGRGRLDIGFPQAVEEARSKRRRGKKT